MLAPGCPPGGYSVRGLSLWAPSLPVSQATCRGPFPKRLAATLDSFVASILLRGHHYCVPRVTDRETGGERLSGEEVVLTPIPQPEVVAVLLTWTL